MQIWWQFGRAIDLETRHNMPLDHFLTSTAHQSSALPCQFFPSFASIICLLFFFSTIPGQHSLLCPPPHCLLFLEHSSNYLPCWHPIICLVGQVNPIIWLFGTLPIYLPIICLVGNVFFQLFASSSSPPSSLVDNIHPVISFFHHLAIICTGDNYSSNFALLGALGSISLLTAPSSDVCHDGDKDNRDNMLGGCISVATSKLGTSSNYLPWFLLFALLATLLHLFDTSSDFCLVGSNYLDHCCGKRRENFWFCSPNARARRSEESRRGKEKGVLRKRRKTTGPHILSDSQALASLPIICLVRILPILWNVCRTHARQTYSWRRPALSLHCCAIFRFWASCWRVIIFYRFPSLGVAGACCVHVCLERSNGFNWWTRMGYGNLRALAVGDCW